MKKNGASREKMGNGEGFVMVALYCWNTVQQYKGKRMHCWKLRQIEYIYILYFLKIYTIYEPLVL